MTTVYVVMTRANAKEAGGRSERYGRVERVFRTQAKAEALVDYLERHFGVHAWYFDSVME